MPGPHPLNHAVIIQVLHHLRHGQLLRCKAMGFSHQELAALKQPALISILLDAPVLWCQVTVNHEVLQHLLHHADDIEQEITAIDRMLRLGASTEMVGTFYGLTHREVALRRDILGLPKRKGRPLLLSEAQEATLWQSWQAAVKERDITHSDDKAMLDLTLALAEKFNLPAAVIWAAVRRWREQSLGRGRT
jgi:hypothetical protein